MNILQCALVAALVALSAACGKSEPTPPVVEEGHAQADSHDEHGEEAGHIELSAEQAAAAGIEMATTGPAQIREVLSLYGTVQPNAERVREVTARYPGVVLAVNAKVGDVVRMGETLATVESNESLRTYQVTSPLAGVITARTANPGENAGEAPLFTVADLSTVWVELALFPRDLPKVRVGQQVLVRSADAGLQAEGTVAYVAALGQATSQTLTARVLVNNAERHWTPGLYVTGDVVLAEALVPVAVKSGALQTLEGGPTVFVMEGDGFAGRQVVTGRADADHTEIRSGLEAGVPYAATNSFVLKSELGKGDADHDH